MWGGGGGNSCSRDFSFFPAWEPYFEGVINKLDLVQEAFGRRARACKTTLAWRPKRTLSWGKSDWAGYVVFKEDNRGMQMGLTQPHIEGTSLAMSGNSERGGYSEHPSGC